MLVLFVSTQSARPIVRENVNHVASPVDYAFCKDLYKSRRGLAHRLESIELSTNQEEAFAQLVRTVTIEFHHNSSEMRADALAASKDDAG